MICCQQYVKEPIPTCWRPNFDFPKLAFDLPTLTALCSESVILDVFKYCQDSCSIWSRQALHELFKVAAPWCGCCKCDPHHVEYTQLVIDCKASSWFLRFILYGLIGFFLAYQRFESRFKDLALLFLIATLIKFFRRKPRILANGFSQWLRKITGFCSASHNHF